MKLSENIRIKAALDNLRLVIKQERQAGRIKCRLWEVYAVTDTGVSVFGEGCRCPACQGDIAEAAIDHFENVSAAEFSTAKQHAVH